MVPITSVAPGSLAAHAGVRAGDSLLSLNGHAITDVLDYRFYLTAARVTLADRKSTRLNSSH